MTKWKLNINFILNLKNDFSGGSTAVQYSPYSSKVEGLCPASVATKGWDKVAILLYTFKKCHSEHNDMLTQW